MNFQTQEIKIAQLGKDKKNWRLVMFGRRFAVLAMLFVQFAFFFFLSWSGARLFVWLDFAFMVVGILLSLFVIRRNDSSGFKLLWVFFILSLPIFGVTFYFLIRGQLSTKKMRRIHESVVEKEKKTAAQLDSSLCEDELGRYARLAHYLRLRGYSPVRFVKSTYFKTGEEAFASLISDLEKAEKYIFLEYFIVNDGVLWQRIFEILQRKAAEGVEVRLMMDDMGCFMLRPRHFARELEEMGIKVHVFNPFRPFISAIQNNRDHRKIAVIDGCIAHTGGLNIADEYVNLRRRFGYWKDTAIRMEGAVAEQWAAIFLALWDRAATIEEPWEPYLPTLQGKAIHPTEECDGTVIPYADSPIDKEPICRNIYLYMIQNARKHVYICTPYLLPDEALLEALLLAAKSGVDVRIVVPYHADKKLVKMTGRTYFAELIRAGVRVYEYTPGFNHGKMFLVDGELASVGSANLDYRSLFLHYECGALVCGGSAPLALRDDFEAIFKESAMVELPQKNPNYFRTVWNQFLRLIAPLM